MITSLRNLQGWAAFGLLGLLAGSPTRAESLIYEPFDYAAGQPIDGKSGGTGFGDAWVDFQSYDPTEADVVGRGLAYSGLATLGNSVRSISSEGGGSSIRDFASPIQGVDGTTTWVSFLYSLESSTNPADVVAGGTLSVSPIQLLGFCPYLGTFKVGSDFRFGIGSDYGTPSSLSNITLTQGEVYFLAASIDWHAGDTPETVRLYVNPATGSNSPDPSTAAAEAEINIMTANGFQYLTTVGYTSPGVHAEWDFDEIRIDSSYGAVAPVPEPVMWPAAAVAAGLLFLTNRRLRRSR